jgi:hypothetical protein
LLFILKKSNTPQNTFLRKNTATPTITDNAPSLRTTPHHYGQAPSLRAPTRNPPIPVADAKKSVGQPTSVIAGNDPQTDKPRRCGLCASLRATTRNTTAAASNYRRKKNVKQPTPVIAGNDPQTDKPRRCGLCASLR